jgi:ABC-2 type transport system permease protein
LPIIHHKSSIALTPLFSALLYLRLTSFRNWLSSRVRRLRQPKYLLGALVGCAYFYFFFFRNLGGSGARRIPSTATPEVIQAMEAASAALPLDWLPATTAISALALLVFATFMWVVPTQRAALGFTEAEIAFLFPAPISRRNLVHFRLLSAQFRSLVGAAVMMLFSNGWSVLGGNPLTHAIGWWFIFSTLSLHFSGANFTLTRLADLGLGAARRRMAVLLAIAAVFTLAMLRLPEELPSPPLGTGIDLHAATEWLVALTSTAPLSWLLLPFQIVAGPFLAVDAPDFLLALGPAIAVVALHYLWVVRSAVAFEDASVDYAQKRGARIAAWRSGESPPGAASTRPRPAPFRLASTGRPELAFLWKNLLSTWQYFTLRVLLVCAALILATSLWLGSQPEARGFLPGAGALAVMVAGYTLIVGPQFARQDIRSDLAHADILKTYPLPGWQIVLGEMLAPIAILTGVLWLTLLVVLFAFHPQEPGPGWLTPSLRITGSLGLAVLAPALVALQLLVPNAAALMFPAWFHLSRTRGGGPEVIGQRMIFFFAQLVTMVVALLPAIGSGFAVFLMLHWIVGPAAAVGAATLAVLAVLLAEVGCGLWWLGGRFESLDLSAELRS